VSPPSSPIRGIAAIDRLAERLADEARVRLGVADSPAELIAAHRLRFRHASQRGRARREDHPDGLERDDFDTRALQICAWDGDVLVGTVRLVLPIPDRPLPTEQAFGITIEPRGEVVDVGHPVVAAGLSGDAASRGWAGLFAQVWFETRARGYTAMAGAASARAAERYRGLGIELEPLGPARAYWGEESRPMRLDPLVGSGRERD
jgi:hypothetical protein